MEQLEFSERCQGLSRSLSRLFLVIFRGACNARVVRGFWKARAHGAGQQPGPGSHLRPRASGRLGIGQADWPGGGRGACGQGKLICYVAFSSSLVIPEPYGWDMASIGISGSSLEIS